MSWSASIKESRERKLNPAEGKDTIIQRTDWSKKEFVKDAPVPKRSCLGRMLFKYYNATTLELMDPWERGVFSTALLASVAAGSYYCFSFISTYI